MPFLGLMWSLHWKIRIGCLNEAVHLAVHEVRPWSCVLTSLTELFSVCQILVLCPKINDYMFLCVRPRSCVIGSLIACFLCIRPWSCFQMTLYLCFMSWGFVLRSMTACFSVCKALEVRPQYNDYMCVRPWSCVFKITDFTFICVSGPGAIPSGHRMPGGACCL